MGLSGPFVTGLSQADGGSSQVNTEVSEANANPLTPMEPPLLQEEDRLRLIEDQQARTTQIDKGLSQIHNGITQPILSQI